MLHYRRTFAVAPADTAEDLARKLTEQTWCACQAFSLGRMLFANDSLSENGAQEYAVFRIDPDDDLTDDRPRSQVESVTFGWMAFPEALDLIRRYEEHLDEMDAHWSGPVFLDQHDPHLCDACR